MPTQRQRQIDAERLPETLNTIPGLEVLREAAAGFPVYLVGGAVRDLLLGRPRADIDVAVEADVRPVADALGGELVEHERFATASVTVDGLHVDLARARAEGYERPGALPDGDPGDDHRRSRSPRLHHQRDGGAACGRARPDRPVRWRRRPPGGRPAGSCTTARSSTTRPGLCGRRATRPGSTWSWSPRPRNCCASADLGTVSNDRVEAELRRIAGEDGAPRALELIGEWGLLELARGRRGAGRAARGTCPRGRPGRDSRTPPTRSWRRVATDMPPRP